jgi:hypothetical protein
MSAAAGHRFLAAKVGLVIYCFGKNRNILTMGRLKPCSRESMQGRLWGEVHGFALRGSMLRHTGGPAFLPIGRREAEALRHRILEFVE